MDRPDLRIVPPADYDARPNLYNSLSQPRDNGDHIPPRAGYDFAGRPEARKSAARHSYFAEVAADWREIISEVRGSPYSHGLVALAAIVFWTAILVAPLMIGRGL